jgi:radical SAM protein with 4Fe4S-binding SPASM domain
MFRLTEKGETVSDKVFENARRLTSKLKGRSCRSTICPETVPYMFKSVKFICEDLGFDINNQVLAGGVKWTDQDIEGIKEQTRLISDWWMDKMRMGKHYSLYYLRNMFTGIWMPIRNRKLCGAGCGHASIDTDGNIYPCHRFTNESTPKEYLMGNIFQEGVTNLELENKLTSHDVAVYLKDKCSNCIAVNSCHALCLHEMMLNGSMFDPLEHYCKIWPIYYQEAMRVHSIMMAERNQLYMNVYRPKPPIQQNQNIQNSRPPLPNMRPRIEEVR